MVLTVLHGIDIRRDKKTAKSIPDGEKTTKKGERIMRKNKFMRAASGLLVAVLLTTCVISGTFAKYTTESKGNDSARVAKWGFKEDANVTLKNLFSKEYTDTTNKKTVASSKNDNVIAPGTSGEAKFGFVYEGDNSVTAPEVAYTFTVSTEGSSCGSDIKNNPNIVWSLDGKECTATGDEKSWDVLLEKIESLEGNNTNNRYEAGVLPSEFNNTNTNNMHTVSWKWEYDKNNNDTTDTGMGNADTLQEVTLKVTITATQID